MFIQSFLAADDLPPENLNPGKHGVFGRPKNNFAGYTTTEMCLALKVAYSASLRRGSEKKIGLILFFINKQYSEYHTVMV